MASRGQPLQCKPHAWYIVVRCLRAALTQDDYCCGQSSCPEGDRQPRIAATVAATLQLSYCSFKHNTGIDLGLRWLMTSFWTAAGSLPSRASEQTYCFCSSAMTCSSARHSLSRLTLTCKPCPCVGTGKTYNPARSSHDIRTAAYMWIQTLQVSRASCRWMTGGISVKFLIM